MSSCLKHAIQPIQQFRYTSGKNSTDSALIIDAMDLLYTGRFGGFCLVSSDSDFTRLATRLRESGLTVYGFGEKRTPSSLIAACDKFVYVEILGQQPPDAVAVQEPASDPITLSMATADGVNETTRKAAEKEARAEVGKLVGRKLQQLLNAALDACADESGWAHLGAVGQYIVKQHPDFDSRHYGKKRLGDLVKTIEGFITEARTAADGKSSAIYVHRK